MTTILTRRRLLAGAGLAGAGLALPGWSRVAFAAAPTDKRFVVVILRGALDGLSALPPVGDPAYAGLRGDLAIPAGEALPLDAMFGLHPAMPGFKAAFDRGQLAAFHAVAIPVRERSHFEAQAILETGLGQGGGRDGWLNRALAALGERDAGRTVAFSPSLPLILRGDAPATSFTPSDLPSGSEDFMARMAALYAGDAALGPALAKGLEVQAMAADASHAGAERGGAAGEDVALQPGRVDPQMPAQRRLQHRTQIGGRGEIAVLEELGVLQPRPVGEDPAALDRPAQQEGRGPGAVVGAPVAVGPRGAAELGDERDVFPGSAAAPALDGVIRA